MSEQRNSAAPAVLVGVDGSTGSMSAVEWAARTAAETGRILFLCMVIPTEHAYWFTREPILTDELRLRGEEVLSKARDHALDAYPQLHCISDLVSGQPAEQLVRLTGPDDLLVLGGHGAGWVQRLQVGSTCAQAAAHASGTVVVTRTPGFREDGPIVAGVDDSAHAHKVLAFGFETAARLGRTLHAVHVVPVPPVLSLQGVTLINESETAGREVATDVLDNLLNRWAEKYPQVRLEREIASGAPGRILVQQSQYASLMVVSSRGRGGFAGLLLGSVSQHVLALAECPVAIAH